MSVSYWQDTEYSFPNVFDTDIVIVGAGLAGLSAAYWLHRKEPNYNIVVVDKGILGAGASGRNAGMITCGSTEHFSRMSSAYGEDKAMEIWKFTEDNHKLLVDTFGFDHLRSTCDYRQQGSWTLASTETEVSTIKETVSMLYSKGVNVGWVQPFEMGQHFRPNDLYGPCIEGFLGGARYYDDGEIHPMKLLRILGHEVLDVSKGKVGLLENREVFGIDTVGNKLELKITGGKILTDAVVLATNAWSSQLSPFFEDKIAPTRGQILVTEPCTPFLEPCYCSYVLDYFRQLVDGRVLIGGFRNVDVEKEVGLSDEVNPIIHEKLEGFLNEHFPLLRGIGIDYRWSGVMGFSADGYPMVGSLPTDPQVFYTVGFTAHGLGFTFKMGQVLADLMIDGKDPGIFSGRRFN